MVEDFLVGLVCDPSISVIVANEVKQCLTLLEFESAFRTHWSFHLFRDGWVLLSSPSQDLGQLKQVPLVIKYCKQAFSRSNQSNISLIL